MPIFWPLSHAAVWNVGLWARDHVCLAADPTEAGYSPKTNAQVTAGPLLPRAERYEAFGGLEGRACPPLRPGLSFKGANKPSYRQQRRTSTGTLSASWSVGAWCGSADGQPVGVDGVEAF